MKRYNRSVKRYIGFCETGWRGGMGGVRLPRNASPLSPFINEKSTMLNPRLLSTTCSTLYANTNRLLAPPPMP